MLLKKLIEKVILDRLNKDINLESEVIDHASSMISNMDLDSIIKSAIEDSSLEDDVIEMVQTAVEDMVDSVIDSVDIKSTIISAVELRLAEKFGSSD